MKSLNRLRWLAAIAGCSTIGMWTALSGCSGDDNNGDAGDAGDSGADVHNDINQVDSPPDAPPDGPSDAGDADAPNPVVEFAASYASALCKRYTTCCFGDAGLPDASMDSYCQDVTIGNGGIENAMSGLGDPLVLNGGHLVLDQTSMASCLAGLATLSCPQVVGSEYATVATNCNAAVHGNIAVGQSGCRVSAECNNGFCQWPDGGLAPDASDGTCVALAGVGGACDPRGNGNEECEYKGWVGTGLRCDDFDFDDAGNAVPGTQKCTAKLGNGSSCISEWECSSSTCDDSYTCSPNTTSWSLTYPTVCGYFFGYDAGP